MHLNKFFMYGKIIRMKFFETKNNALGCFFTIKVPNYRETKDSFFKCTCFEKQAIQMRDEIEIGTMVIISGKIECETKKIYDKYYDDFRIVVREIKKLTFNSPLRSSKDRNTTVNPYQDEPDKVDKMISIDKLFDI